MKLINDCKKVEDGGTMKGSLEKVVQTFSLRSFLEMMMNNCVQF
ncbi:unnamed protein product [Trifolium pratense]|uniref:Uncharacterized protein n=1 Tax=Trifolium pratense TaxID=57577 RepID=A0ACB0K9W1_TRIPR|nr:unnamed protein product [Trifolium pratense]